MVVSASHRTAEGTRIPAVVISAPSMRYCVGSLLREILDVHGEVHPKSCTDLTCVYCDTLDQLKHHLKGGAFIGTKRRDEPVG